MYNVVVTDCDHGELDQEREELRGIAVLSVAQCGDEDAVIEAGRDADALIVQYAPISRRVAQSLPKCRVIARYGVGIDMIDLNAASECGICVAHVPAYCTEEVSDHACALMLALARKTVSLHRSVLGGRWDPKVAGPMYPLAGSTLGLLGLGRIGRRVAQKMKVFGMRVIACDPFLADAEFTRHGVSKVDMPQLLAESDILSLHAPLTPLTDHILGAAAFAAMKRGAFIVNTARGRLIDEQALVRSLREGGLGGSGLDVVESEPLGKDSPLLGFENVIVTPHAAFYSERSFEEVKRQTARAVSHILQGKQAAPTDGYAIANLNDLRRAGYSFPGRE